MILAGLCFALMIACVKVLRPELSTLEIIFYRGLIAAPISALFVLGRSANIHNRSLFGLRVLFGLGGMYCYYSATRMPLADLTLVTRLQPILIAVVAPFLFGASERSSGRVWGLLALGVIGCALLLAPRLTLSGDGYGWWAVGALLSSGAAHLCLRGLRNEDSRAVVLWLQVGILVLAALLLAATQGAPSLPAPDRWGWVLGVGGFAAVGQLALTRAYAIGRAGIVAGASNISPLWALILDIVLFSTFPSPIVLVGGALILTASVGFVVSQDRGHQQEPPDANGKGPRS